MQFGKNSCIWPLRKGDHFILSVSFIICELFLNLFARQSKPTMLVKTKVWTTSIPWPDIMVWSVLNLPKTCSFNQILTFSSSNRLKLAISSITNKISYALAGTYTRLKALILADIYNIMRRLQTRFIEMIMKSMNKPGIIKVSKIDALEAMVTVLIY